MVQKDPDSAPLYCLAGARARGVDPFREVDAVLTPTPLMLLCGALSRTTALRGDSA